MTKAAQPREICQVKITLKEIHPPIWRRVLVPGDITLAKLHRVIQRTMGWSDSHLHEFRIGDDHYGPPDSDSPYKLKNEKKVKLSEVVSRAEERFQYDYDFGDGWQHEILVELILKPDLDLSSITCIGGERACPPEDCGGVPGYAGFLEAIRDPKHERHEEMLEWSGGEFDPEEFDMQDINRSLKSAR